MFSNILSSNGKSDHDVMSHSVKQALKIAQIQTTIGTIYTVWFTANCLTMSFRATLRHRVRTCFALNKLFKFLSF